MCIKRRPKNRWNRRELPSNQPFENANAESNETADHSVDGRSAEPKRAIPHFRWRKRVTPSPTSVLDKSSAWKDKEYLTNGGAPFISSTDSETEMSMTSSMLLSWHNINAYATETSSSNRDLESNTEKPEKKILDNVFGTARPGEVLAIMGSSGAGKTSLLNTLTQRNTGTLRVEGDVKVNGQLVDGDYMRKVSAYVQQDDMFLGALTVEEHLLFCARLRMSDQFSKKAQERRVLQMITELGLREVANCPIGTPMNRGISGGQRKRLAFASEILTSPPILLCDEPTSGLDSFLAFQVVSVLRKLAEQKGMTVVLTIHQPSSQVFELFDRIYLMAEGRVAFCGSQSEASSMFDVIGSPLPTNFNPADHYISTLAVKENRSQTEIDGVMGICEFFEESSMGKALASESSWKRGKIRKGRKNELNKYQASWLTQMQVLVLRNFLTSLRDPVLINMHICQAVCIGLIGGYVFSGNDYQQNQILNINGVAFMMLFQLSYLGPFEAIWNNIEEFPLYHREYNSNLYRVSSYYLAKNIAELPFYTLTATIFSVILYLMSAVHVLSSGFFVFFLTAILVQCYVISLGYAFSYMVNEAHVAFYILEVVLVAMQAVGGLYINLADIPIYFSPLTLVSYFRYGFETLVINDWKDVENIPGNCTRHSDCPKNGDDVINSLSFNKEMMWPNVGIILIIIIVMRLLAFGALYFKTKSKK